MSKKKPEVEARYPKLTALWKVGEKAMTFEQAKAYLGWREDDADNKFTEFDIELPNGRRVVFDNNRKNRPWHIPQLRVLKQEHLNRNWRMNPDGIGIGMYESIMSGQHRLRSFCEAEIERQSNPEKWGDEPLTMECVVVLGLDESDETFRILNTGAPATASDAFYRQHLFPKETKANRVRLCQMLESAIKTLWVRTGKNRDGYAPERTNSEVVDFHDRHKRIEQCVTHIHESYQNKPGAAQRMPTGSAAALMYLMGCSATDAKGVAKYREKPSDKPLDWSLFDKAHDFWTELVGGEAFECVRDYLNDLCNEDDPMHGAFERKTVIVKAWNLYRAGDPITRDNLELKTVGTGLETVLDEFPDLGGIDLNEGEGQVEGEAADTPITPDEVEAAKAEVQETKAEPESAPEVDPYEDEKRKVTELRVAHRNKVLLFVVGKNAVVVNEDAKLFNRLFNLPIKEGDGKTYIEMPMKTRHTWLASLKTVKKRAVWVRDGGNTVEEAV